MVLTIFISFLTNISLAVANKLNKCVKNWLYVFILYTISFFSILNYIGISFSCFKKVNFLFIFNINPSCIVFRE